MGNSSVNDVRSLTRSAFEQLRELHPRLLLQPILLEFLTAEAQKYAENLRLSSISAQKCYQDNAIYGRSFGIDALDLSGRDYIDSKGTSLGQVLEVIQKSKRDAKRFSDEFSRITLALIARTKGLVPGGRTAYVAKNFAACASECADWWNDMYMSQVILEMRLNNLIGKSRAVGEMAVRRTLYEVASDYKYYFDMLQSIPENLVEPPGASHVSLLPTTSLLNAEDANHPKDILSRRISSFFGTRDVSQRKEAPAILQPPAGLNMKKLIQSTERAFHLISPWCEVGPSNSLPSALGDQMSKYGQAITLSILSAQYVFTIAEEAKSLIQQLASDTTQEEVSLYMAGMSDLAKSGLEKTTTALSVFKDVRQALIALISNSANSFKKNELSTLKKAITVLEAFKGSVSLYVEWWTRMNMAMSQQSTSTEEILQMYSAARKNKICSQWERLASSFQEYSDKMRFLQDRYPDLFERFQKSLDTP